MDPRGASVIAGAIVLVGALTGLGIFKAIQSERAGLPSASAVQVLTVPVMGRQHVEAGEAHAAYASNPPTSGPHYGAAGTAATSKDQPVDEALVALLERGYVWISYNPSTADQQTVGTLNNLALEEPALSIVVTARPQDDAPVAVAGWGRVMKLQRFTGDPESEDRALHAFMRSLPPNAPEYQPTPAPQRNAI